MSSTSDDDTAFRLTIFRLHYSPVYAGWLAVDKQYKPIGLKTLSFDPEMIHQNESRAIRWQLTDRKWNNTSRFLSTKTHKEFDCEHPRVRALQVIEFSRQMDTGQSKPSCIETGHWQPVEERTANHTFWKAVCRKP